MKRLSVTGCDLRSSKQGGFFLAELQISAAVLALIAAVFYQDVAALLNGWSKMHTDMELSSSGRYMLSVLENDLGYESRLVTISRGKQGTQLACQTIYGGRKLTFTSESGGLYKQTKTTSTTGKNPLFIPGMQVADWQAVKISDDAVMISFALTSGQRQQKFKRVIHCLNGQVVDADE